MQPAVQDHACDAQAGNPCSARPSSQPVFTMPSATPIEVVDSLPSEAPAEPVAKKPRTYFDDYDAHSRRGFPPRSTFSFEEEASTWAP
eukprot:1189508-Pyramimonas_sp.AAC.1